MRNILGSLAVLALFFAAGCGGDAPKETGGGGAKPKPTGAAPAPKPKAAGGAAKEAYDKSKHTGSIKGVATWEGEAPKRMPIKLENPECAALHKDSDLNREDVPVVTDGKVANVVVYVKEGHEKYSYSPPADALTLDQKGCQYIPHVLVAMPDQVVNIKNSDALAHNVHGLPSPEKANKEFNESQPKAGDVKVHKFKEPEMNYKIKCDIHQHMSAWAHVFEHPFAAVTKEDGKFEITGLPAGEYKIEVWHENAKVDVPKTMTVSVKDGAATEQEIKLKLKP